MAIRHQLHPARGADLARSGGATGGQHHIDATSNQGIDDGNRLYLFRPGGHQYQYAHLALLACQLLCSALLFDGLIETLIDRHRDTVKGGLVQQEAGDGFDLGLAALFHVLIHGRVIVGGELHHHHDAA